MAVALSGFRCFPLDALLPRLRAPCCRIVRRWRALVRHDSAWLRQATVAAERVLYSSLMQTSPPPHPLFLHTILTFTSANAPMKLCPPESISPHDEMVCRLLRDSGKPAPIPDREPVLLRSHELQRAYELQRARYSVLIEQIGEFCCTRTMFFTAMFAGNLSILKTTCDAPQLPRLTNNAGRCLVQYELFGETRFGVAPLSR